MMKHLRKFPWIAVIMLQAFLAVGIGFLALSFMKVETIAESTHIGGQTVGGMSLEQAREALDIYYRDKTKTGVLVIEVDQNSYKIPYSDLDISVDIDKTMDNLKASMPQSGLMELIGNTGKNFVVTPVIKWNSGKLLTQCESIFKPLEKTSVSEYYEMDGDVLRYVPQVPGMKINYRLLEEELIKVVASFETEPYRVETQQALPIFMSSNDPNRYDETFTTLVSKSSVAIDNSLKAKASNALQSTGGLVFKKGAEINLASFVEFELFSNDIEKDLLNRIATALYQSALSIEGIQTVNRKQAAHVVPYSEPGLEAVIEGEGANLVLKNDTDRTLMLLHDVSQGKLTFYWISTGSLKNGILITQKKDEIPPSIITTIDKNLSKGQTRVVSEGSPGYTVLVSRIIGDERQELYIDKYLPVSKMVEAGESAIKSSSK